METQKPKKVSKSDKSKKQKTVTALKNREYERLNWTGTLQIPNLIRIRTDMDGSCFFHAVAKAFFKPYIFGKSKDGTPFDRKKFIKNLRKDLSKKLAEPVDPEDPDFGSWYETMAHGEWPRTSKTMKEFGLKHMQKELNSNASISNIYNEYISDQLDIDIYILDAVRQDVYMTASDNDLLYKDRRSVVILYLPGHYELIGTKDKDYIQTQFRPNSNIIQIIKERMNEKTA